MQEAVVDVAVSLNNDIMTLFWLHKWARTPKSDPSSVLEATAMYPWTAYQCA